MVCTMGQCVLKGVLVLKGAFQNLQWHKGVLQHVTIKAPGRNFLFVVILAPPVHKVVTPTSCLISSCTCVGLFSIVITMFLT